MNVDVDGWTPVALSIDLPKGGVIRTFVDGRDLVVWRSRSGAVRAFDNRCPHRGMRLSFGFVRGESLTCIYHGWQYGTDGICHTIPAHPDLTPPAMLCATAFAAAENDGLVWASLSEMPEEPGLDVADVEPVRSLPIDRDIATVRSILTEATYPITEDCKPADGDFTTTENQAGLIIREGTRAQTCRQLVFALQPLPRDRTTVHVLTSPAASPGLKIVLSRRLERIRWSIEHLEGAA